MRQSLRDMGSWEQDIVVIFLHHIWLLIIFDIVTGTRKNLVNLKWIHFRTIFLLLDPAET